MEMVKKLVSTRQGGWERMNKLKSMEDFYGSENILCMIL